MNLKKSIKHNIKKIFKLFPQKKVTANISILPPAQILKGRTALITGGTSGIGYQIAKSFVEAGAFVIITGRTQEKIDRVCNKMKEETGMPDMIMGIEMNNKNINDIQTKFQSLQSLLDNRKIDILVNNAGVVQSGYFGKCKEEDFDNVIDTNLKGTFFITQMIAAYMRDSHIEGNILNITSSSSLRPANSAYTISKWGLRGFTIGLAKSLIKHGIVVNAIAPGPTATPGLLHSETFDDISNPNNPLGRLALPQEIAMMAVFLVSNAGRTIVGDTIYMTGGAGVITYDDVNYNF